jgi:hypothetical protein
MRWMVIYEYELPEGTLVLNSTNYTDHANHWILPYQGKIHMVEPEPNPGPYD